MGGNFHAMNAVTAPRPEAPPEQSCPFYHGLDLWALEILSPSGAGAGTQHCLDPGMGRKVWGDRCLGEHNPVLPAPGTCYLVKSVQEPH